MMRLRALRLPIGFVAIDGCEEAKLYAHDPENCSRWLADFRVLDCPEPAPRF